MLLLLPVNKSLPPKAVATILQVALESQIAQNMILMGANPGRYPPLYQSGVRYRPEPLVTVNLPNGGRAPVDEFVDVETLYARKRGDCDDIVCAFVAERRLAGDKATPRVFWRTKKLKDGRAVRVYHTLVRTEDNQLWDPSRDLGMM